MVNFFASHSNLLNKEMMDVISQDRKAKSEKLLHLILGGDRGATI